ncbi:hypothetical protein D3C76_1607890 [compost metagenome]
MLPADAFGTAGAARGVVHEADQVNHLLASGCLLGQGAELLVTVAQDDDVGVVDDLLEVGVEQL